MPEQKSDGIDAHRLIGDVSHELGVGREVFHDVAEALERLAGSLNQDARLHQSGVLRVDALLRSCLRLRYEITRARTQHSAALRRKLKRPMFIIGLPGSGTTLLHHLLSQDAENRTPRLWELSYPLPPPDPDSYESNPRIAQTEFDLGRHYAAQPGLQQVQMQYAREPAECSMIFTRCLASPQFLLAYSLPGYAEWLWQQPLPGLYGWYRDELLLLQTSVPGNWVLRSSFHQWGVESLRAEFPDALLVQTHREPIEVLASGARFCASLRIGHSGEVDPLACGRDWSAMAERYTAHFERWYAGTAQTERDSVMNVSYRQLIADPVATVSAIYHAWGRKLGLQPRMRMQAWLKQNPLRAQGEPAQDAARYGLDTATTQRNLGAYIERAKPYF